MIYFGVHFELKESHAMKIINTEIQFLQPPRLAVPADLDKIINAFTDSETLPFPSQRFPSIIEKQLPMLLMSGLLSAERELLIYCCKNGSHVAFTLCEAKPDNTLIIILAGVWPNFRGRGVFRQIIEKNIIRHRGNHIIVMCGPDMHIAQRQLRRLGFGKIPNQTTGFIYQIKRGSQ